MMSPIMGLCLLFFGGTWLFISSVDSCSTTSLLLEFIISFSWQLSPSWQLSWILLHLVLSCQWTFPYSPTLCHFRHNLLHIDTEPTYHVAEAKPLFEVGWYLTINVNWYTFSSEKMENVKKTKRYTVDQPFEVIRQNSTKRN